MGDGEAPPAPRRALRETRVAATKKSAAKRTRAPRAAAEPREAVVLVHGIWLTRLSLVPLQQRLRQAGFDVHILSYPSLRSTPAQNAARLRALLGRLAAPVVHVVGHSLGGLVALHLLEERPPPSVGRCVLMGTPANGSAAAHLLARSWLTRKVLGRSTVRGLLGETPRTGDTREVGVIAGSQALGLGRLVRAAREPNDGTVAVSETVLAGARDHITLPVSHTGLLFSRSVAAAVTAFLRTGRFPRP
jgi:pimeloyl-ACP methyl ester carboxylesterase